MLAVLRPIAVKFTSVSLYMTLKKKKTSQCFHSATCIRVHGEGLGLVG